MAGAPKPAKAEKSGGFFSKLFGKKKTSTEPSALAKSGRLDEQTKQAALQKMKESKKPSDPGIEIVNKGGKTSTQSAENTKKITPERQQWEAASKQRAASAQQARKVNEAQAARKTALKELDKADEQIRLARQETTRLSNSTQSAQSSLTEAKRVEAEAQKAAEKASKNLQQAVKEREAAFASWKQAEERIAVLKKEKDALQKEMEVTKAKITKLQSQADQLSQQAHKAVEEIQKVENPQIEHWKKRINELERNLSRADDSVMAAGYEKKAIDSSKRTYGLMGQAEPKGISATDELQMAQKELGRALKEDPFKTTPAYKSAQARVDKASQRVDSLQKELTNARAQLKKSEENVAQLRKVQEESAAGAKGIQNNITEHQAIYQNNLKKAGELDTQIETEQQAWGVYNEARGKQAKAFDEDQQAQRVLTQAKDKVQAQSKELNKLETQFSASKANYENALANREAKHQAFLHADSNLQAVETGSSVGELSTVQRNNAVPASAPSKREI